jgi:signal transduction histidine kinase
MKKMNSDIMDTSGLKFFGKVTASVSHEIKNVLAIIKENAGLLEDLTLLADKGRPLEIERVRIVAEKIKGQILRGDGIIKNMNRFAHSVDWTLEQVDLGDIIGLVIELARRLAFMKRINLESKGSREGIMLSTNPFVLENLIWTCLNLAMESEPYPETIEFFHELLDSRVQIRITGLQSVSRLRDDSLFKQIREDFMDHLKGDLDVNPESGEIVIRLPQHVS